MFSYNTIARPYAKAAFEFAIASQSVDLWCEFLQTIAFIVSDKRVAQLLENPRLTIEQKKQFIEDVLGKSLTPTQHNFLQILAHYQRLRAIPAIAELFTELVKEQQQVIEVKVTSAFSIDEEQQQRLQRALKIHLQREINLTMDINQDLIGGAVIRAGDFVIDGSSAGMLQRMRQALQA